MARLPSIFISLAMIHWPMCPGLGASVSPLHSWIHDSLSPSAGCRSVYPWAPSSKSERKKEWGRFLVLDLWERQVDKPSSHMSPSVFLATSKGNCAVSVMWRHRSLSLWWKRSWKRLHLVSKESQGPTPLLSSTTEGSQPMQDFQRP